MNIEVEIARLNRQIDELQDKAVRGTGVDPAMMMRVRELVKKRQELIKASDMEQLGYINNPEVEKRVRALEAQGVRFVCTYSDKWGHDKYQSTDGRYSYDCDSSD